MIPTLLTAAIFAAPSPTMVQGLWSGQISCPAQILPMQLLAYEVNGKLQGNLVSQGQFFSMPVEVSLRDDGFSVAGDVPGNVPLTLGGPLDGDSWHPTLNQAGLVCPANFTRTKVTAHILPIAPSYQVQPMWCWLTVAEMVFRYYGVLDGGAPDSRSAQCAILQLISRGSQMQLCSLDCNSCGKLGAGSSRDMAGVLVDYPRRLSLQRADVPLLFSAVTTVLSPEAIRRELDADRPFIIGISPSYGGAAPLGPGMDPLYPPQHVALVVGYVDAPNGMRVLVNDPYPFPLQPQMFSQNPYVAAGAFPLIKGSGPSIQSVSYWIAPAALQQLRWTETFLVRRDGTHGQMQR